MFLISAINELARKPDTDTSVISNYLGYIVRNAFLLFLLILVFIAFFKFLALIYRNEYLCIVVYVNRFEKKISLTWDE